MIAALLLIGQKLRARVFKRAPFLAYSNVDAGIILLPRAKQIVSHHLSFLKMKLFTIRHIYAIIFIFNNIKKVICQLFLLNYYAYSKENYLMV